MEPDREARAQGSAGVEAAARVARAEGVVKEGAKAEAKAEARAVVAASVSQQGEARATSRRAEGCAPRPCGGPLPLVATKSTEDCRHAPDARFDHKL